MTAWWASLRVRLALTGFVAIYVPVLILLTVVTVTEDTVATIETSSSGIVETTDIEQIAARERPPWVFATAALLAPAAAAAAWWWAGRATLPIERIRRVIEEIESGALDRRIGLAGGPSEISGLARSFDSMLERLEAAASAQRELIEETSHQLRTPLAVLSTNADVLLSHPQPTTEVYREGLQRSQDAARHLTTIIEELLVDARGRARTIDRRPTDLVGLARSTIESVQPLAAEHDVPIELRAPEPVEARIDAPSVDRAVNNLLDNAIRHSPPGQTIQVEIGTTAETTWIAVTDRGAGIKPEDQAHILDRFWSAADGGTGLGLPIANQIAQAHGGRLLIESPSPLGDGCRVTLSVAR